MVEIWKGDDYIDFENMDRLDLVRIILENYGLSNMCRDDLIGELEEMYGFHKLIKPIQKYPEFIVGNYYFVFNCEDGDVLVIYDLKNENNQLWLSLKEASKYFELWSYMDADGTKYYRLNGEYVSDIKK